MKCLRMVLAKLLESDVVGVLSEALTTHVQVILPTTENYEELGSHFASLASLGR